jgi:hypothetical protein
MHENILYPSQYINHGAEGARLGPLARREERVDMTGIEDEIFEVWKELFPSDAFRQGLPEYAGRLFVPTPDNKKRMVARINELMGRTDDPVQLGFLRSLLGTLEYHEVPNDLGEILWTIFAHLIKEGINPEHLVTLLDDGVKVLDNAMAQNDLENLPLVMKITLMNKCTGILGLLKVISDETDDVKLKESIENISEKVSSFKERVMVSGIDKGDFSEVFPVLKEHDDLDMGRMDFYPRLIKDFYDYYETPDEIEAKALSWLESELPNLQATAGELAGIYGTTAAIETVDAEVAKQSNLEKSRLLDFIKNFRDKTRDVMENHLVKVNPKYDTRIIPTPDYLVNFIPTAAMTKFDTLTDKPFNIFFVTTDEKRSPPSSIPDIFQLIIHEEYGHCVNFSNSAVGFAAKPTLIENLNSRLHYPISEGISFHRELESMFLLEDLIKRSPDNLSKEERAFLDTLAEYGDIKTLFLESKFVLYKWRIMRFLRAVSDVRINMNRQTLPEFVEWASEKTGFAHKTIYDQLFIFQEQPGYAPCYSIAGMALKDIQDEARRKGKDILEFNTVASSLGFPPRTIWEERLRNF